MSQLLHYGSSLIINPITSMCMLEKENEKNVCTHTRACVCACVCVRWQTSDDAMVQWCIRWMRRLAVTCTGSTLDCSELCLGCNTRRAINCSRPVVRSVGRVVCKGQIHYTYMTGCLILTLQISLNHRKVYIGVCYYNICWHIVMAEREDRGKVSIAH